MSAELSQKIDERVLRIVDILNTNFTFTLDALEERTRLSGSRLQHLFKPQMGVSMRKYLQERQLQQAAYLLLHTDMPLKQIAPAVGIPDPSNLVRYFKRRFGVTPDVYRKRFPVPQQF